eukprot:scaffold833_cov145-Skeletonema_menzelii.AAC.21
MIGRQHAGGSTMTMNALEDVECGKLEIIGDSAFARCKSLRSINLPSVRIVEGWAFYGCEDLTGVKFSSELERFDQGTFSSCASLERITIPLKDDMITADNMFMGCENLKQLDLVEGEELRETIAALHFEEWRNEMNREIDSINRNLPTADAGGGYGNQREKAQVIHTQKIPRYFFGGYGLDSPGWEYNTMKWFVEVINFCSTFINM